MSRIIGFKNFLRNDDAVFSSVDELATGPLDMALDGKLFGSWQPPNPTPGRYWRFIVDFDSAVSADYIGIGGHNLGKNGETIILEYWDGSAYQSAYTGAPLTADDEMQILCYSFPQQTAAKWRFTIDAGSGNDIDISLFIAVLNIGEALEIPRLFAPFSPPGIAQGHDNINNISQGGRLIGSSAYYAPFDVMIDFRFLEPAWVRDNLPDFVTSLKEFPFFILWDSENYPDEAAYCWTYKKITPPKYDTIQFMSWSLAARGLKNL